MAENLILWGAGTSRTIRPHWMLLELGLDYESRAIGSRTGETLTPEFARINPRHKIPALQHDSVVITESAAIIQYLSEAFPRPDLIYAPSDSRTRARMNEWCYFIMTELDAGSLYVMRRHKDLAHIYGDAPVAVESAKTYFNHNLQAMAPQLPSNEYLFGNLLSVADILLVTCLDWARIVGITLPSVAVNYRGRVANRPAYQAALLKNFPTVNTERSQ